MTLLAAGCGEEEPGSVAAIERDLKDRPVRDLYQEAEDIAYAPPANGLLTDQHISNYLKVRELGAEITKVASARMDQQLDEASRTDERFTRMATAFAGLGSARAVMTAELRAALMLDINPHEIFWVATEIARTGPAYRSLRNHDERIATAQAELDAETDSILRERKRDLVERETKAKDALLAMTGDVTLANAETIERHRVALAKFHRELGK